MSDCPIIKKQKIDDSEVTNGETVTSNGIADCADKKENNSNNHQSDLVVDEEKKPEVPNATATPPHQSPHLNHTDAPQTPPPPPTSSAAAAPPPATTLPATQATQGTPTTQANRLDPNEIIAQLKESLRQEEAKLQFLRKLKITQAKLKERQERIAAQNQTKEESKDSTTSSTTALIG